MLNKEIFGFFAKIYYSKKILYLYAYMISNLLILEEKFITQSLNYIVTFYF